MNELLGINASYDITTIILKEKLSLTKNYMVEHYEKIKTVFCLKSQLHKDMDNASYNSFIFQVIKGMYKDFNGNIFGYVEKEKKHKLNEVTYCFRGLDLGNIVKKCAVKDIKDETLFDFEDDKNIIVKNKKN